MAASDTHPPPPIDVISQSPGQPVVANDPPPPYPSRERRVRINRRYALRTHATGHHPTVEFDNDILSSHNSHTTTTGSYGDDEAEPTESTPFLGSLSPQSAHRRLSGRPRSLSHTSTVSAAPSLARTVLSLFQEDDYVFLAEGNEDGLLIGDLHGERHTSQTKKGGFFSLTGWKRYFRPMGRSAYYWSLFHLTIVNFPYALLAWVYLFVFTLCGTTLLMALPLGAVLCFFNLLGARSFSRGELALQTRFHSPLAYAPLHPPHPIFTRFREPTGEEIEAGQTGPVKETSFYKNSYSMFTDPTSYQALFYFLVIKPAITLLLSLGLIIFILPSMCLILPAPAALRVVRRLGIWQANVAIEGLYLAVR